MVLQVEMVPQVHQVQAVLQVHQGQVALQAQVVLQVHQVLQAQVVHQVLVDHQVQVELQGQEMIMANSDTAFQTALVVSYDPVTGILCYGDIITQVGTGIYNSWQVNLSGNVAGS